MALVTQMGSWQRPGLGKEEGWGPHKWFIGNCYLEIHSVIWGYISQLPYFEGFTMKFYFNKSLMDLFLKKKKSIATVDPNLSWCLIHGFPLEFGVFHVAKVFPSGLTVKNPPAMQEPQKTQVRSLGQEDPLEDGMATHSSILAWRISRTEEPGGRL